MSFTANLPVMGPAASQSVAIGATSAQATDAIGAGIRVVRLVATSDCHVKIGSNPTATTADLFLPAGCVEWLIAHPGQKVAAIQSSASGTLYVSEMTK